MAKKIIKKVLITSGVLLLLLIAAVTVHVYMVTRPKAPDGHTRIMARMDFKQPLTAMDSARITSWLQGQKGIDHVLCNPSGRLVVFTFFPIRTSANQVVSDFNAQLPYHGLRYLPSEAEMKMGCPVASNSFTYKAYNFLKNLF